MEQSTGSQVLGTNTWDRLDASVRPPATFGTEPPRATAVSRVGIAVEHLGGRLRSPAVTSRVAVADQVGRALQRAGGYLDERDLRGMRIDAERLIVRRPIASVLVALVVGYLAGRAVWR
jgi:hypothetical protein